MDVHVLNSADNSNLNGVEVKVTNMETGYVTTDVTNANGFVQFAVSKVVKYLFIMALSVRNLARLIGKYLVEKAQY